MIIILICETAVSWKAIVSAIELALQNQIAVLYAEHHGWLRGWLRKKLGDAGDAADLAHDTYLRILSTGRVPQADESRRHLTQVAKGLVIDLYRRREIEYSYLEAIARLPEGLAPSEEMRAIVIETLIEIDAILHRLAPKARAALLMCRLDGMSYREIASELQVSVSSVEKYIAAGLLACWQASQAFSASGA